MISKLIAELRAAKLAEETAKKNRLDVENKILALYVTPDNGSTCCSCRCAPDTCAIQRERNAKEGEGVCVGGVLPLDQVLYSALDLLRVCMEVREQLLCGLRDLHKRTHTHTCTRVQANRPLDQHSYIVQDSHHKLMKMILK